MATPRPAATTLWAGVLMLALTGAFGWVGVDAIMGPLSAAEEQRMVLSGAPLDAANTTLAILGGLVLAACLPYVIAAVLLLRRRASGREGAMLLAGAYGAVALATAGSTILAGEGSLGAWLGVVAGVVNGVVVVLLLSRPTRIDVEEAERRRSGSVG